MAIITGLNEKDDFLDGTNVDDTISGLDGNDTLHGLEGNDTLIGGNGADSVYGDDGDDTLIISGAEDNAGKLLDGGFNNDTLQSTNNADISGLNYTSLETLQVVGTVHLGVQQLHDFKALTADVIAGGGTAELVASEAGTYKLDPSDDVITGVFNLTASDLGNNLYGDATSQILQGGQGDDLLDGGEGDDIIIGNDHNVYTNASHAGDNSTNDGTNTLIGGGGNDTLYSGTGIDHMFGGSGDDTFSVTATDIPAGETIDGGTGNNTLDVYLLNGANGPADLSQVAISNVQTLRCFGTGQLIMSAAQLAGFNLVVATSPFVLQANETGTYDVSANGAGIINFKATDLGSIFIGNINPQTITGGLGRDDLSGGGGNDVINGGDDVDWLYGGEGNDTLTGGSGADEIYGEAGDDIFVINAGEDNEGKKLDGGADNNVLKAAVFADLSSIKTITNIQTLSIASNISLREGQLDFFSNIDVSTGISYIVASSSGAYSLAGKNVSGVINFNASDFGNSFVGDGAGQNLTGGLGDDTLSGMGGNDFLTGGGGTNTLLGGEGDDTFFGTNDPGANNSFGGGGDDTLYASLGFDSLHGEGGDDVFLVNADTITAGEVIDGGSGINRLIVQPQDFSSFPKIPQPDLSALQISNIQKLEFSNGSGAKISAVQFNALTHIIYQDFAFFSSGSPIPTLVAADSGVFNLSTKLVEGPFNLSASDAGNTLIGNDAYQILTGGLGRDILSGMGGDDTLHGGNGNDVLNGNGGLDRLFGEGGADIFTFSHLQDSGGDGQADFIADFTPGVDKIDMTGLGFTGVTTGVAGPGQLTIGYNDMLGRTTVRDLSGSGFGFDIFNPGLAIQLSNADFIGLVTAGTITGTASNNILQGSISNDTLSGLGGSDQLFGNGGNDTLDGGAGVDQLTGGAGADTFKFLSKTDSVQTGMDRIADFVEGTDKIDLTGLGFTGITNGTAAVGQLKLTYDSYYKQTYVKDLSGSGFGFYLSGNHSGLANGDFLGLVSSVATIIGTAANNVLQGSAADEIILGLGGADQLFGNGGNDTLDGGAGVDQLTGGAGADIFKFATKTDSQQIGMDRIADFVEGTDKIDLTGLGFTGLTTGTPTAGQLKVSYDAYYKQTYVRDLTGGSGFGFYLSGNHAAISNNDVIGLVNAMAATVAAPASSASASALQQMQLFTDLADPV